jgi:hypothetical protein
VDVRELVGDAVGLGLVKGRGGYEEKVRVERGEAEEGASGRVKVGIGVGRVGQGWGRVSRGQVAGQVARVSVGAPALTMYEPVVVRVSAPMTTPSLNCTAMIEVWG